jgi:hypothetical protein
MTFPVLFLSRIAGLFLIALMFLGIALWGLISRKPLVFSQRYYFFIFVPILAGSLFAFLFNPQVFSRLGSQFGVMGLTLIFCFVILMKTMTGYSVMGATEKSFRAIVTDSLRKLGEEFTEDMNGIHLERGEAALRTNYQLGTGYVRPKNKEAALFMKTLGPVLREESKKDGVEYDPKVFLMYLGLALIFMITDYTGWEASVAAMNAHGIHP